MEDNRDRSQKLSLLFIGDTKTGKTSIINKHLYSDFDIDCQHTMGITSTTKKVNRNSDIRYCIADSSGLRKFEYMIPICAENSTCLVLVFDITNYKSFLRINELLELINPERQSHSTKLLIGNKSDRNQDREVSFTESIRKAEEIGAYYFEVSARTGENVNSVFKFVFMEKFNRYDA